MDFDIDFEPPEKRVLTWLSQMTVPASSESIIHNYSEHPEDSFREVKETVANVSKKIPKVVDSSDLKSKVSKHSTYKKSGLKKYFEINDSDNSSTISDTQSSKSVQCKRLYCYAERKSIVQYIVKKKLFAFVKGNFIWKQMEEERICDRSWQSMKAQFHRYIYQHLEKFSLCDEERNCFEKYMERNTIRKSPRFLTFGQRGWRKNCKFYTFVEDAQILYYVLEKNRYEFSHGNAVWKKLEYKDIVAGRSWHSVRSRYKNFLSKYVERFVPKTKQSGKLFQRRLDSAKKSEILQDFLLDNLLDIAVSVSCISESKRNTKELKRIGIDCTFSIPLPRNNPSTNEKEAITQCALKIVQQFSKKMDELLITKDYREFINVLHAKYLPMTEDLNLMVKAPVSYLYNIDVHHGNEKYVTINSMKRVRDKFDLFDSVQQQLRTPTSIKNKKEIFQTNFVRSASEQHLSGNAEEKSFISCITTGSPKSIISDKATIFSDEIQSDLSFESNAGTCTPNFNFNDHQTFNDDLQFSNENTAQDSSHFSSCIDKTAIEIIECPEIIAETSTAFETLIQNEISVKIKCEDNYNELQQQKEINCGLGSNDNSKDDSSCMLPNISDNIPKDVRCLEMCVDDSNLVPKQEACTPDNKSSIDINFDFDELHMQVDKEDPIENCNSVSCKLFDISLVSEKNETSVQTKCEDKDNGLLQPEEINCALISNDNGKDEDSSCALLNVSENIPKNMECLELCIDDSYTIPKREVSTPDNKSLTSVEVNSDSEESVIDVERDDLMLESHSDSCKLFNIIYESEKNCPLYSSLLESKGKNLRLNTKDDSCSLFDYYISAQKQPNSEIMKSSSKEDSQCSESTQTIVEYMCESEDEQELNLRLESEESGDED